MLLPRLSLTAACLLLGTAGASGQLASPEVRATWLTTTASTDLAAGNVNTTLGRLADAGLNTVYVEAWKNGYTNFRSPTLDALLGFENASLNPLLGGRDLLAETSLGARSQGLVHVAWMEYGLSAGFAAANTPFGNYARDNDWLLTDQNGATINSSNSFAWMNPLIPEVREFLVGISVDAVRQYGLDGVQFDDRLAWPVEFGYDDTTRAAYLAETGRNLPSNPRDSQFVQWRADKVTEFAVELTSAIRAAEPDAIVSASPSVYPFSLNNYAADWEAWADLELFDEYMPQVYRDNFNSFAFEWQRQRNTSGDELDRLGAGLRILGTGASTPWNDIRQMLQRLDADDAYGHSFWYSNGLTNADGYLSLVKNYYAANGGDAAHPLINAGLLGDANRDGVVSILDFAALRANFGRDSGVVWRDGDFDTNGVVNILDFALLRATFGNADPAAVAMDAWLLTIIPEPATTSIVGAIGLLLLRRKQA